MIAVFPINIAASAIQMQAIAGQQYDHDDTVTANKKKPSETGKSGEKVSLVMNFLLNQIKRYLMGEQMNKFPGF